MAVAAASAAAAAAASMDIHSMLGEREGVTLEHFDMMGACFGLGVLGLGHLGVVGVLGVLAPALGPGSFCVRVGSCDGGNGLIESEPWDDEGRGGVDDDVAV